MSRSILFFFFNDTATTEIYTLSLHDALPISARSGRRAPGARHRPPRPRGSGRGGPPCRTAAGRCRGRTPPGSRRRRSEEHTSELQSRQYLVCRLLLEKKKNKVTHSLQQASRR